MRIICVSVSRAGRDLQGSVTGPDSVFCEWRAMPSSCQTDWPDTGDGEGKEILASSSDNGSHHNFRYSLDFTLS